MAFTDFFNFFFFVIVVLGFFLSWEFVKCALWNLNFQIRILQFIGGRQSEAVKELAVICHTEFDVLGVKMTFIYAS